MNETIQFDKFELFCTLKGQLDWRQFFNTWHELLKIEENQTGEKK